MSRVHNSRWIGSPARRVEDPRLLLGRARYLGDLRLPGMVEAAFVRSPHAHAAIRAVDLTPSLAAPGVTGALSGRQIVDAHEPLRTASPIPGYKHSPYPALASEWVCYVGQPVAIVAAADRYQAEDAAERVQIVYEPLPAVTDMEQALGTNAPLVHPNWGDNVLARQTLVAGDVDTAFAEADLVYRGTFRSQRVSALPLESRGCLAWYDSASGQLTLWSSTQIPHIVRLALAEALRLPSHHVRVIAPDVGGGFGAKAHVFAEEVAVSLLARQLARPVRWVEDRPEHLLASIHARQQLHHVEAAVRRDGTVLALRARILVDAGAYSLRPPTAALEAIQAARILPGPYKIRHYAAEWVAVATNKCSLGTYRGVGRPMACFTIERTMDEVARMLGLDPLDIRRRNLVRPDEFPYTSAAGLTYDSGSFMESLDRAADLIDCAAVQRAKDAAREHGRYLGLGVACYTEQTASAYAQESAVVRMDPMGKVTVLTSIQSHGQGLETTLAQVVAEQLSVPLEDVLVLHGDTLFTPSGFGTFNSRSAVLAGGATMLAAQAVREKALAVGAHVLEANPDDIEFAHGRVQVRGAPERSASLAEVATVAYEQPQKLPPGIDPGLDALRFSDARPGIGTFANGTHAVVVEVDPETGVIRILRYIVVEDTGRIINPMIVEAQAHGGVIQGIGATLLEELAYDEQGQLLTMSLMDYLVPSAADVPTVEVEHFQTPSRVTITGFKGAGEGGAIAAPAAIANAVADALAPFQILVNETPLSPARVLGMIRDSTRACV